MAIYANVIAVNYVGGRSDIDMVVAILKGINNAARNGNADFGVRVTITYVSVNDTIETLDSGRMSIANHTAFLANIDNRTVSILLKVPLGSATPPGQNPNFSATAQVLHRDTATSPDDELGPAEQTFPAQM
jgi:hypothetical protein